MLLLYLGGCNGTGTHENVSAPDDALVFMATGLGWTIRVLADPGEGFSTSREVGKGPFDVNPAWSPGKKSIYFTRGIPGMPALRIWKIDWNGKNEHGLTPATMTCDCARPSLATNKLVLLCRNTYSDEKSRWDIYLMDPEGRNLQLVTDTVHFPLDSFLYFGGPSFSRDGRKIVFTFVPRRIPWPLLAILDLATYELKRFPHLEIFAAQNPRFSPTRDEFLFCGNNLRIYRVNEDGSDLVELAGPYNDSAEWSADGERIVYEHDEPGGATTTTSFQVMNRDGSGKRLLMQNPGPQVDIACPSW